MKFNEDLTVIHAYLCADGYVIKNLSTQKHKYYKIGLRNTNYLLLKDFQKRFENIWGIRPILTNGQRCQKGSKNIYKILTKNFGSFYSWEWRMPNLSRKLSRIWLRTYFDCEGWVSVEKHKSRLIGVDCVNLHGLKQVKKALAKNGINSKIKNKKGRKIFRLYIYGKDNLIKFKNYINFYHPQKAIKLQEALEDYVTYDWKFPNNSSDLESFLRSLMQEKAKVKNGNGTIRIISNRINNVKYLRKQLRILFCIESKINKSTNGIGTKYYELNIYKRQEARKIIDNKLLNEIEAQKWQKLKK